MPLTSNHSTSLIARLEQLGNRLPDPATLFLLGTMIIVLIAELVSFLNISVSMGGTAPDTDRIHRAQSLLSASGLWWAISHLVSNFIEFPPLGIVLTGMLGIGFAERIGLIPALLRRLAARIPDYALTPAVVLLGILSSMGLDAGYVVLPPVAASLYLAAGRAPLAGIAAAFAGISAGFSANLVPTALDPLLAGFTQAAATFIDPDYHMAVTANWYLMIVSTGLLTLTGWAVTAWWVEPRLPPPEQAPPTALNQSTAEDPNQLRGLWAAGITFTIASMLAIAASVIPGAPLYGLGEHFPRWVEATVPLIFVLFMLPGVAFGIVTGALRSDRDAAKICGQTMADLGPYIVLAFFAAQFIACFKYSGLGEMLAIAGGSWLAELAVPASLLMLLFIGVVMIGNLLIGSMSAKYAFFAPVFVPMFMHIGISPALTQAAYRIGDSVTNVITPLNPYMIIILAVMARHAPGSGLGTLIAMMLPYTLIFTVLWSMLLLIWMAVGLPLGPGGALGYP